MSSEKREEIRMEIVKGANGLGSCPVEDADLALINALARKELKGEEVYTFAVRLCDNEVDREWERFSQKTLEELAPLFVGKSGIFDHSWSSHGQAARIYKTQVVSEEGKLTQAGDPACYLKGWAYMLRTEGNAELIAQIEGGIKKEVSVGCAVEKAVCSVCGEELGSCRHVKGRTYNGKLCYAELTGAKDAYEWSFVAVPAQPRAGVIKSLAPTLKELVKASPAAAEELKALEAEASLGRKYLDTLRDEVVKLCAVKEPGLEVAVARSIAEKLDEGELRALKTLFARQVGEDWDGQVQLTYSPAQEEKSPQDEAFLI